MSDKHESKQKSMRAKAHIGDNKSGHTHQPTDARLDAEFKDTAGNHQEELTKFRSAENHATPTRRGE